MKPVKPPAKNPCGSCPYRRDVPSGVWSQEEYEKLPEYDRETGEQPPNVFLCHQQDGRACAGWVGCHDMYESLGFRIATLAGAVDFDHANAFFDYATTTPLFDSGAEAALHGLRGIEEPDEGARRVIDKLTARQRARGGRGE